MKRIAELKLPRLIYSYEFPKTNSVYVGLTGRVKKRKREHLSSKDSPIRKHILENGFTEDDYILTYFARRL